MHEASRTALEPARPPAEDAAAPCSPSSLLTSDRLRPRKRPSATRRPQPQPYAGAFAASCPHAASMSCPRVNRTVAVSPCSSSTARNAAIASRDEPS